MLWCVTWVTSAARVLSQPDIESGATTTIPNPNPNPNPKCEELGAEPAKECVTTHLPKQLALKMDGAKASHLYSAVQLELALAWP